MEDAFEAFSILKKYHPDFSELNSVIELQFQCAENLMNQKYKKIFGFKNVHHIILNQFLYFLSIKSFILIIKMPP